MTGRGRGESGDRGSEPLPLFCSRPPDPEAQLGVRALARPALGKRPRPSGPPGPTAPTRDISCPRQLCFQAGCLSSDEEAPVGCRQRARGLTGAGRAGGQHSPCGERGDPRLECVYLWPSPTSCLREGAPEAVRQAGSHPKPPSDALLRAGPQANRGGLDSMPTATGAPTLASPQSRYMGHSG